MNSFQFIAAGLFDRFKAKNPFIATCILLILGTINYIVVSGIEIGAFSIDPNSFLSKIIYAVSLIWGLLQGSRTSVVLATSKIEPKETENTEDVEVKVIEDESIESDSTPQSGSILDILYRSKTNVANPI